MSNTFFQDGEKFLPPAPSPPTGLSLTLGWVSPRPWKLVLLLSYLAQWQIIHEANKVHASGPQKIQSFLTRTKHPHKLLYIKSVIIIFNIFKPLQKCFSIMTRPATSLGHQGGWRVFWEWRRFFKLCPILSNDVQHILPGGRKIF